jgi:hypothetical protein
LPIKPLVKFESYSNSSSSMFAIIVLIKKRSVASRQKSSLFLREKYR